MGIFIFNTIGFEKYIWLFVISNLVRFIQYGHGRK